MTREEFMGSHSTVMSRMLTKSSVQSLIIILDGTYFYIEKSSNIDFQKRSYSMQKFRNLVKAMIVCMPDGYIIEVEGVFYADGKNNDASILNYMYAKSDGFLSICGQDATLILDGGFCDSIAVAEEQGHVVSMPRLLAKGQKQFTDLEGNASRMVTKLRWVIESVNGRIKNVFHFFRNTISNHYVRNGKMKRFLRIACAMLNA